MSCGEVQRLLTEDQRVAKRSDVKAHLRRCPSCQKVRNELRVLEKLSRQLSRKVTAPPHFRSRLFRSRHRRSGELPWRLGLAAAALLLVSVLALWGAAGLALKAGKTAFAGRSPATVSIPAKTPAAPVGAITEEEHRAPSSAPYVEVVVGSQSEPEYILRLPSRIVVRRTALHQDINLHYVSR